MISLTPVQAARLEAIYVKSLPERRRLREQLTKLQNELARALADGRLDDNQAQLLVKRVCEAEKQRNIARTMMLLRMYRVLAPDQRSRLAKSLR